MNRPQRNFLSTISVVLGFGLILIVFLGPIFLPSIIPSLDDRTVLYLQNDVKLREAQVRQSPNFAEVKKIPETNVSPEKSQEMEAPQNIDGLDPPGNQHIGNYFESETAASKLACPAFVLEFVINATDTKDECEGLRKAFDLTCGGAPKKEKGTKKKAPSTSLGGKRRLTEAISTTMNSSTISTLDYFRSKLKHLTFRRVQGANSVDIEESSPTEDIDGEIQVVPLSPSLPTTSSEVGDELINDALSLNTDLKDIAKAIEDINNATNSAQSHPITDANDKSDQDPKNVESSKKDHEAEELNTAVAVSAVIHSPRVIETQECCRSILHVFHEECDSPDDEEYNDKRLFVIVCVIALCGLVKSLIRHFKIRWLPEAGGCILVGVVGGIFMKFLPNMDFGFQHDMFLRLMVPPIVFEAALNIDKRSFSVMTIPIVVFAVWGTFMSTILTAAIVYYGSAYMTWSNDRIPFIESLAFGSLISSIDPIAVLSVLNNMGMSDKDQIYVLIFGESLLNDGVAIVLFQTLVHFMDENMVIDNEACWLATLHFLVIAFGSLFVGVACGAGATLYFWLMKGIQTPLVEVLMFMCWAFIPYYVCDGIDWSGIVSIVAAGFFMDIYVIGSRTNQEPTDSTGAVMSTENGQTNMVPSRKRAGVFSQEGFLSSKAKNHIGFVTEINSTLMETAIFAYLGIFLFNRRYHWNVTLPILAVFSCIASRSIMVVFSSTVANAITRLGDAGKRTMQKTCGIAGIAEKSSSVIIDGRMQIVLIFAGLRGAMSFALVETVPMYDATTGEGSRYKPELKAMTSASIMFTVFVLGGYTYYLLEKLGLGPAGKNEEVEMVSLINEAERDEEEPWAGKAEEEAWPKRRRRNCLNPKPDPPFHSRH